MLQSFNRLFSTKPEEKDFFHPGEVTKLPVKQIVPNRFQPRTIFNEEKIKELAQTIHTHGMIQPIVVREIEKGKYELIAGERRLRAIKELEWETVPSIIRDMNDTETASVALIENIQREELTVIEEAKAYEQLLELHSLTQEALAQRLGKSQSTIANRIRLLKLPEEVQNALLERKITERHARALIKLKESDVQIKFLNEIIEQGLNVKQTEDKILAFLETAPGKQEKKRRRIKFVNKDIRIAMNTLNQSLKMISDTGIGVESEEDEFNDYYQITIRIKK